MDLSKELQGMLSNSDLFSRLGKTVGVEDASP